MTTNSSRLLRVLVLKKNNVKFKIERITSPRVIDKKTFYSGQGTANRLQYVYDPEEISTKVLFYKQLLMATLTRLLQKS